MGQLIDDLLHLSKVGRAELHRERVDLSALAGIVAAELKHANPERLVRTLIASGVVAEGDHRLLRIVRKNLLGNAWKFSGGVADAVVEFGVCQTNGLSTYFVRDNGAGFDMAYTERLFTPFQRLHLQSRFPGTGIGLATVHPDRHGGRVWAESAVDHGATFLWTLPALKSGSLT